MDDEQEYDNMGFPVEPVPHTAPKIRIIFVSEYAKVVFLERLSDGKLLNIEIGASDEKPFLEVDDISCTVFDDNGNVVV